MTFLGFFVRDVMMARMYGLGHDLDAFVLAGVVPMFMVSVFSVPLGAAVIPFIEGQKITSRNALSGFIQRLSLLYLLFTAIVSISFYCGGRYMLHSSDWGSGLSLGDLDKVEFLSLWMLAIFVVSGFLTIANGVLSSFERPYLAAVAQLLVPAVVIVALVLLGDSVGVIVVPIAMFVGQVLNLIFLIRWLAQEDIFLWPFRFEISIPNAFGRQYFPLVIGTIFMQITVPVSTILAASLQSGDLAALGLGGKLVIFLTGLITAGLASVVLPYFANLLVQKRVIDARRELSFLLLSATVFSVPLTILLYFFSGGIVKIFFEGGVFNGDNAQLVTSVMEFGALQLPFFFVNTIMLKYAIAMQRSGWVLMASLVGLLINVFLNFILSRLNGVAGVSLAMSISVAVTAGLMLVVFLREKEVAWLDFIYILINWMLFISLIICLHYSSWAGVFSAFLAYSLLLYGEWQAVSRGRDIYVAA
jgi:putative peptidoglycan lipid II flippase